MEFSSSSAYSEKLLHSIYYSSVPPFPIPKIVKRIAALVNKFSGFLSSNSSQILYASLRSQTLCESSCTYRVAKIFPSHQVILRLVRLDVSHVLLLNISELKNTQVVYKQLCRCLLLSHSVFHLLPNGTLRLSWIIL